MEKHGRDPKVLDVLCSLCVGNGVAVRSSQNNICDFLLPGKNLLLQTLLVDHVARYNNIKKLQEKFTFTIPNVWNNSLKLEVTNKMCGHTFTSRISNLLHIDVNCSICNDNIKRQKCLEFNVT